MGKRISSPRAAARALLVVAGVLSGASIGHAVGPLSTPLQVEEAFAGFSAEQDEALRAFFASVLAEADFSALWRGHNFAAATGEDPLTLGDVANLIHPLVSGLPLVGGLVTFEWETEVDGVVRSHTGVLNTATPLDVDNRVGVDVTATLSLNGTSGITVDIQREDPSAVLPLKIRAIVQDPRSGSDSKFALGYDARHADAPDSYVEDISIAGLAGSTRLDVAVNTSGAGAALALLAEELSPAKALRRGVGFDLRPVPATVTVAVGLGSNLTLDLGASASSLAALSYTDATASPAQRVTASLDRLPDQLSLVITESGGDQDIDYSASAPIARVEVEGHNLTALGDAEHLYVTLADVPQALDLTLGSASGNFALDAGGASLGLIEALFTSGPITPVPAGYDGLTFRDIPGETVLAARVSQLRRLSGSEEPLSLYLDSLAGNPVRVELRSQPAAGAKQVYTVAELHRLQRHTNISITESGNRQLIHYDADATASSLSLATNAGDRQSLTASLAIVPTVLDLCAASDNSCSASGKPGNVASMRVTTAQRATLNLHDCQNSSCSEELKVSNLDFRKIDTSIEVGRNCPWYGCYPQGSKGSIWLDTDNERLNGTVKYAGADFKVKAGFGPSFRSNDRYVKWSYFTPTSKSGSISCGDGTYLDVTVFGVTIDVAWLYLC